MMTQTLICPVCDEGTLTPDRFADDFKHNGGTIHVEGLECYRCDRCGADPVLEDQIRRNHLRIADAKRRADGLLTGEEIRTIRSDLGLSQQDAALLFGGGANAFSKYERGDVVQSVPMDRLLRLAARYPALLDDLRQQAGVETRVALGICDGYTDGTPIRLEGGDRRSSRAMGNTVVVELASWQTSRKAA